MIAPEIIADSRGFQGVPSSGPMAIGPEKIGVGLLSIRRLECRRGVHDADAVLAAEGVDEVVEGEALNALRMTFFAFRFVDSI